MDIGNKSLDGIKKLSEKELKRSRKIVLDFIGEKSWVKKEKIKPVATRVKERGRRLDGLSRGTKEAALLDDNKKERMEMRERSKEERKEIREKEKVMREKSVARARKEIKEREKKLKREKVMREERAARMRKEVEIKRKQKEKFFEKEKARKKRKQKLNKFKKNVKRIFASIFNRGRLKKLGMLFILTVILLAVFIVLGYFVFASFLLKLNFDNKLSRQIAQYVPVPAVVTKLGFIEYYDYLETVNDLYKKYNNKDELKRAAKIRLAEEIIFKNLAKRYGLQLAGSDVISKKEEINSEFIDDQRLRSVPFSRINKITQLIKKNYPEAASGSEDDFGAIGEKYGDEQGYIKEREENIYLELKEEADNLGAGQVSDIIAVNNGYYIIKKEDNNSRFIFVKAMTLDEYLTKVMSELKIWFLAD